MIGPRQILVLVLLGWSAACVEDQGEAGDATGGAEPVEFVEGEPCNWAGAVCLDGVDMLGASTGAGRLRRARITAGAWRPG
ncbi:MAG: hypothetical protein HC927_00105 [Deltaproteobacteria bacterium]|nr:hypothetical protein [Deltaproteobacteria bacterium]